MRGNGEVVAAVEGLQRIASSNERFRHSLLIMPQYERQERVMTLSYCERSRTVRVTI
jgi:hypothetical protein